MRIKVVRNLHTCEELGDFIGYKVNSWTRYPEGYIDPDSGKQLTMEVDIEADKLDPAQWAALAKKLTDSQVHLALTTPEGIEITPEDTG
jgi:hypothetical protein